MRPLQTIRNTSLRALATVVIIGSVAHGGLPYLPLIGPPPLRMLASKNPAAADVIKLATAHNSSDSNTLARIEATAIALPTNSLAGTTNLISSSPFGLASPDNPLSDSRTATIFAMPTPDLLGITPQMLVNYFHPVTIGTNANAFIGPYPVGFTPPITSSPDKSSRAEYIVK